MGKRYETEKKIWGGDRHSEEFKSSTYQNDKLTKRPQTNENLAKEAGYQFDNQPKPLYNSTIRSRVINVTTLQRWLILCPKM